MPGSDWIIFSVSAVFVVGAGMMVGRISGEIGERLGLGRAWAGAVLISFATTLPELATTTTVAFRGAYGLALGNIVGTAALNLAILVIVDLADPNPLYNRLSKNHLATGILGAALMAVLMTALSVAMSNEHGLTTIPPFVLVVFPVAMLALYGIGQFVLFRMAQQSFEHKVDVTTAFSAWPLWKLGALYAVTAVVLIVAALFLGATVDRLSKHYSLAATFAGATMLGIVTSLPEVSNAIASSRRREYDLAVGNILGANALVLVVLAVASLLVGNKVLSAVPFADAMSALVMAGLCVLMQAVALGALAVESGHHFRRLSIASIFLASLYAASLYFSYQFGGS